MNLKPEEISKVIRSQIKYYSNALEQSEIGTVLTVGDGIVRASGLSNCMAGELLAFENGAYGLAQNLEENRVSIVLLGTDDGISEGQTVKRTGKVVSVPVGDALLGRVVDALGQPIDGKGPVAASEYRPIERQAPGICDRQPVKEPLQTGIKAIDSMIPINRNHGIDCLNSCLKRLLNWLTVTDTRCLTLNWTVLACCYRSFAVNWLSKCIYNTSKQCIAYRHRHYLSSSLYSLTLADTVICT